MAPIEYKHSEHKGSLEGPRAVLPLVFERVKPLSVLDVGCGIGFWIRIAGELGIKDIFGIDGISIDPETLLIPKSLFKVQDLTTEWNLDRKFDLAICLEVAEHLEKKHASTLIKSIAIHADTVLFSAACPGQPGQHHVNCQWPEYWQRIFNEHGFICRDEIRSHIWKDHRIEPWYRQNIFIAYRDLTGMAGSEPRIAAIINPDLALGMEYATKLKHELWIEQGRMPANWYFRLPWSVLKGRMRGLHRQPET